MICSRARDMVTVHVPLLEATRSLVNAARLRLMRNGGVIMNFARSGIVDEAAVLEALGSGKLNAYVCDFPTAQLKDHPKVVALPHLGASTGEAEENCAVMVADTLRDFLEQRQHPQLGQLSRGDPAAHRQRDAPVDRQRERAEHGRPDLHRAGRRATSTSPTCSTSRAASSRTR